MNEVPEISIVVPVYKGVRFLREALDSVRAQTFADWECLCVDDGSKDGSGALLDELAAGEPRFRVFHRENGGTSVARNFALSQARGRYIAFLDEDDVYRPQMLEVLHAAAEKTGADVVGCEKVDFGEEEHPSFGGDVPPPEDWQVADRRTLAEWMSRMHLGIPFSVWLNLYRRDLAGGHLFRPNVRVEQDMLWHYTLMPKVRKYVKIPWAGYAWRESSIGGFLHPDAESVISWTRSFKTVLDEVVPEMGMSEGQRERMISGISEACHHDVWEKLHGGVAFDRDQLCRLREGLHGLSAYGVNPGQFLRGIRKLKWRLFLLTGLRWS